MKKTLLCGFLAAAGFLGSASHASAQTTTLLATGTLTSSKAGDYTDLSGLDYTLENGRAANLLGGLGSGLAYASGDTFLALPDRGPNVDVYNPAVDNTVSYISRFHTLTMKLQPNTGAGLPFTLTPQLQSTTLLHALLPLYYGDGKSFGLGSGAPKQNNFLRHYFTGRSDNAVPFLSSEFPLDARLDPESIRVSNDGLFIYISDEYGPYVYEFLRATGERLRVFQLPNEFFVPQTEPTGAGEIADNGIGRTANKGMEGLAITPDGKTLVGILQAPTLQDAKEVGASLSTTNLLRMAVIDIASGRTIHEFAYALTTGSGVSDIVALNNHEFFVDERDGKGLGDGSKAKTKHIFKIDLDGAKDVQGMLGSAAFTNAVTKSSTPFLDIVAVLGNNGVTSTQVPSKLEGIAFGPDVTYNNATTHTLWVANDNDFDKDNSGPNVFYVFGFTDAQLGGSEFVPQGHRALRDLFRW